MTGDIDRRRRYPTVLLFVFFFSVLLILHAPLLRLPYFWDEAGYYIPAARDLLLQGTLIPYSTPSNAHPPLVMVYLALAWKILGYAPAVTRIAMLAVATFSLLGVFRLAQRVANTEVAIASTICTALYPVFFAQSSLAHLDLAAAGFTFWALLAFVENRRWNAAARFSLAVLAKETAVLAPLALIAWEFAALFVIPGEAKDLGSSRVKSRFLVVFAPRNDDPVSGLAMCGPLFIPLIPLAIWYAYHYAKTGFLLGNPEFFRYNVATTLNPLRIPLALGMRLWQLLGYLGLYLLTLSGLLAMLRPPQKQNGDSRPRISFSMQAAFLSVILAYLAFMSAVGGAVLARYLLAVVPLVILAWVSTLWRRVRYWGLIVGAVAITFVAGLFINPPYGFSLEDNLAYRDYIVMHAEASRFLAMRYPGARILTAWPASDELTRPWLGYVNANDSHHFRVLRIEDFAASQIDIAAAARGQFDVALVFSTKYQPPHPLLGNWDEWQRIKEKFFGYHRDLPPEDVAQRLVGAVVYHKELNGQWIAVIDVH